MPLRVLPDVEAIVIAFLKTRTEVTALTPRISSELPMEPVFPLVTVRRIGGIPAFSNPLEIDQALLQVEAWGRTKNEALNLGRTTQAVLYFLPGVRTGGVVHAVEESMGFSWQPDPTYTPAQPRYLWGVTVTARPT